MTERRVHLRKYSSMWKWQFRKEKVLLRMAKPIIDILAAVSDFECARVQPR